MSSNPKPINVTLLDKEYLIACTDEERDLLHRAIERQDA